ncbi:hypothetical protein BDV36DRAFT_269692 [Aspergillus pseudocaelatus]|uniref:Secreted protein n=1 Tax=Aspergillus pseudocaelatus TaxID=1825620 RepID=A0ABQ6WA33_9EURO|nr:hypothetical protein BDV36DRAFT_269692 [Aspergillus pseudocaelatus]
MIFAQKLTHWLCYASALNLLSPGIAADTRAWKSRSICQVMTDRFARIDGSTTHACNINFTMFTPFERSKVLQLRLQDYRL